MGICPSKYHVPYKYFPELVGFRKTFQCLGITDREVGKIYKIFKSIDIDDSKEIDIAEVLVHLHVEKTFFNKRVFGLLDSDASGELNFEEFTVGLWNYCSVENTHFGK
jgi:Ca2+-binding EF-hand superfamily protein